jgi:hypothetical protein
MVASAYFMIMLVHGVNFGDGEEEVKNHSAYLLILFCFVQLIFSYNHTHGNYMLFLR